MLVLSRKTLERITIGNDVTLTILRVRGDRVKIGISAPAETQIKRAELLEQKPEEGKERAA